MNAKRAGAGLLVIAASIALVVSQFGRTTVSAAPAMQPVAATASPSPQPPKKVYKRAAPTPKPDEKTPRSPNQETKTEPTTALVAHIPHDLPITAKAGKGRVIGTMPGGSKYFGEPIQAWVLKTKDKGRYGKVTLPWTGSRDLGWISLKGLETHRSTISVKADLSEHRVRILRNGKKIMSFPAATGASTSPTPTGRYFVTDRVDIPGGGSFGTYAFGLSGIQTHLPPGWTGGDQLAIHGTSDPGSIGTSASAGCLRVSEGALDKLQPLLVLGTPVTIQR